MDRRRYRASPKTFALLALAAVGCSQILGLEDGTVQGACSTDEDCAPGYGCFLSACRSGCQTDQDCGSGAYCLRAPGGSACIPETTGCQPSCPDGTECVNDRCRTPCSSSTDCGSGQHCDGDHCVLDIPSSGGSAGSGTGGNTGGGGGVGPGTGGVTGGAGGQGATGGTNPTGGEAGMGEAGTTGMQGPRCGDGQLDADEECDDANAKSGDGCSNACREELGFACAGDEPTTCQPICGDFYVRGDEATAGGCDDGNRVNGDGCSASCMVEDEYVCAGEPSRCQKSCGDGVLDELEDCDDGNHDRDDGCFACQVEGGWTCDDNEPSKCDDIDECGDATATCPAHSGCTNLPGSYACPCDSGWLKSGEVCVDDDECAQGSDDCPSDSTCGNLAGSFECVCNFPLGGEGHACRDVSFANWRMPGSTGDYTVSTVSGEDVVRDNVTGLVWQRALSSKQYDWQQAVDYCSGLELAGSRDWRLPMRIELVSILAPYGVGSTPKLDQTAFPGTPGASFWTGSRPGQSASQAYSVRFDESWTVVSTATSAAYARCVRTGASTPAQPRFETDSSTTIDHETHLRWQRSVAQTEHGKTSCGTVGGFSDWRLPTLKEMQTLVHESLSPAIDTSYFPGSTSTYWTSTLASPPSGYYTLNFSAGTTGESEGGGTGTNYRRCVRDEP